MRLLNYTRKTTIISEFLYYIFNIGLAFLSFTLVLVTDSFLPSLILLILSKWRVFAVRPRFWVANIKANLVDFLVSLSIVSLMFSAGGHLSIQILLAVFYAVWLIFIKQLVSKRGAVIQAGLAMFFSTLAVFTLLYDLDVFFIILICWLVGYATSRHLLVAYEDDNSSILSLVFAFMVSEIVWVEYFWITSYTVPILDIRIPNVVFILLLFSVPFVAIYTKKRTKKIKVALKSAMPSIIFSIVIITFLTVMDFLRFR